MADHMTLNLGVVSLGGLILLLTIFYYIKLKLLSLSGSGKAGNLPPGPPSWPVVGHLHLLDNNRPLHQTLYNLAQPYGEIMFLKFGSSPVLVVTSSQLARECLTSTNDRIFASRPRFTAAMHLGYNCTLLGLNPYDRRCRNLRRICLSEVLSPSRVETLRHVRSEEVSKMIRRLYQMTPENKEAAVNVTESLVDMTFDIIVRMVTEKSYLGSAEEVSEFKEMIRENGILLGAFVLGDYFPRLRWVDVTQGYERAMKHLSWHRDEFLQRLIDKHRLRKKEGGNRKLIDLLISLVDKGEDYCDNDNIVKATVMSLINAGTDTSASTMEWAMASLVKHAYICKKAQEEIDVMVGRERVVEESDLPKLKYLEAVIKETLRLYPAGPLLLPHMSTEECSVGGYYVPAGTRLLVNAWGIQRDPNTWERPLQFDPERFLQEPILEVKGQDFKYIPFGFGRRACPGMWMAMSILQLTVGRLLQSFDWSAPSGIAVDMREGLSVTLGKAVPLEAIIKPRLPPHLY